MDERPPTPAWRALELEKCLSVWGDMPKIISPMMAPLRPPAEAFRRNMHRVNNLVAFPIVVVTSAWRAATFTQKAIEHVKAVHAPDALAVQLAQDEIRRLTKQDDGRRNAIFEAGGKQAEQLYQDDLDHAFRILNSALATELQPGAEAWMAAQITGIWTAFEALAEELWEAALNAHPMELAALRGGVKRQPKDRDKSVSLSELEKFKYDLSQHMGTILKRKYNFDRLEEIREAYVAAFEGDGNEVIDVLKHPSLDALSAVRNVIVHNGGIVDEDFLQKTQYLPEQILKPLGEFILLDGLIVASLVRPFMTNGWNLIGAVDNWLKRHSQ
jgi:hypothetical protein